MKEEEKSRRQKREDGRVKIEEGTEKREEIERYDMMRPAVWSQVPPPQDLKSS